MIHVQFFVQCWYQIPLFTVMLRVEERSRSFQHGCPGQGTYLPTLALLTLPFESKVTHLSRSYICFNYSIYSISVIFWDSDSYTYWYQYRYRLSSLVIVEKFFFSEVCFSFILMILYLRDPAVPTQNCAWLTGPLPCEGFLTFLNVWHWSRGAPRCHPCTSASTY